MLTSLHLENWKSFGAGEAAGVVVPFGRVTLFVGPNASGKSNALDALRFLHGAATGLALEDVLRGGVGPNGTETAGIRGKIAESARVGTTGFRLSTTWSNGSAHEIRVETRPEVVLRAEKTSAGEFVLQASFREAEEPTANYSTGPGKVFALEGPDDLSISITQAQHASVLGGVAHLLAPKVLAPVLDAMQVALGRLTFLALDPSKMREYRPIASGGLGVAGENLSPVLHRLQRDDARAFRDVVDWVDELVELGPGDIHFETTQLDDVMLSFVEASGAKVSARSLSDGTLRFLGLVAALHVVPKESIVLLEEPDVGLHPSRVRLLAELFDNVAEARNLQIIATTHSPTLLAHLSPETLANVVAFSRHRDDGTTRCTRIGDLPAFDRLRSGGDVEHLISTGWLERAS